MSSQLNSQQSMIYVSQKKHYHCLLKVFCCKCIYCCQDFDFSLLTSENRKGVFQKMVRKYLKSLKEQQDLIVDPFFIMIALLLRDHSDLYIQLVEQINTQKQHYSIFSKEDLSFYMPQLCTYLVFHQEMNHGQLVNLMERACKVDIIFSLQYYFYLKALEMNNGSQYPIVKKYNHTLRTKVNFVFKLNHREDIFESNLYNERGPKDTNIQYQKYKQIHFYNLYHQLSQKQSEQFTMGLFQSTVQFFKDLVYISRILIESQKRKEMLYELLRKVNKKLPAAINMPFYKQKYMNKRVLSIVFQQCRVFNTKQRAPYYICLQVCRSQNEDRKNDSKIISVGKLKNSKLKRTTLFQQDAVLTESQWEEDDKDQKVQRQKIKQRQKQYIEKNNGHFTKISNEQQLKKKSNIWAKLFKLTNKAKQFVIDEPENLEEEYIEQEDQSVFIFGESQASQKQRIKKISPYSQLPEYDLVHMIIKTNDNLKQQAFAMQLVEEMQRIFDMEKLSLKLTPYQVIPLDHDAGVIQCIKDSITIDDLRKKDGNLNFISKNKKKLKNFIRSLAGYSLVVYLLQVKDRHNGNIMIHKDGKIFHIDFGFFLSNSPGKGVQIQKNVPFKLTLEYVQVMGGLKSKNFSQFRKLFYQGYNACRKHQHRILILAKLMYSSYGKTMPCFGKGDEAIEKLQERFNPIGVRTDADLSLFCQNLINSSVDNWRARWYDKWQYYMQGILY